VLVGSDAQLGSARRPTRSRRSPRCCRCWFFIPFSLVIVVSLVAAAITGVYSSGLALLALGVPLSRVGTTAINTVIISAGRVLLLFISDSFLATFQAFLALWRADGHHGRHPAARLHPAAPTELGRVDGAAARSRRPPGALDRAALAVVATVSASGWSPRATRTSPRGRLPAHRLRRPRRGRADEHGRGDRHGCWRRAVRPAHLRAEDRRRPPGATADPARGRTAVATGR